jgi:ankyrin repeat protein
VSSAVIGPDDARLATMAAAVRAGDVAALRALLAGHPELATDRHGDDRESRTALHLATDWPGHHPRVRETIAVLVDAGAPVDGRVAGPHRETPLHWAASSDDVDAIDALLDAGADVEADGGVLTGGAPLDDAIVFGQWHAARRLVARGARMALWHAAALGVTAEVHRLLDGGACGSDEVTNACWHACRAGQTATTELLVERGADLDRSVHDGLTARAAGVESGDSALIDWLATR